MSPTTVALIDDRVLFREGIASLLAGYPEFDVVAQASTSLEAANVALTIRPQVLLLSADLGDSPIKQTMARVRRASPSTSIVTVSQHRNAGLQSALRDLGAAGNYSIYISGPHLIDGLRQITRPDDRATGEASPQRLGAVSRRELEILQLIGCAASNREMAHKLGIAEGTVRRHLNNLYEKLNAHSRIDALMRAKALGLLDSWHLDFVQ
jgi:DNA-binding NarL/FixJ family response regulator